MRKIKELLRLKAAGLSCRQTAAATGLSLGVVSKYLKAAKSAGLAWPQVAELDDATLSSYLAGSPPPPASRRPPPDFARIHQELKRKGVTLTLLWEEYCDHYPGQGYRYSQFCQRYRDWAATLKRSMRQTHRAGEKLFLDYAGPTLPITDSISGEVRQAQIFVAVLGTSSYTYAEATMSQSLYDWIGSNGRALAFFGGSPEILVPDNLKSGVTRACRYEPELNRSYQEFARHYGCAIIPARPYRPRDKAKVEVGVQVVERWILARLRHQTFFSLPELNRAIAVLLTDLNNRPFKKLPGCRRSAFEALDQPALRPLPDEVYEYAEWKVARVNIDYHIEVDHHYYSVPHSLVKQPLDVRLTLDLIEVFHGGRRVASHLRRHQPGRHSTQREHMPASHRAHLEWTPGRLLNWGNDIGPGTCDVVRQLLEAKPHPEQGYRACLGLLGLAKKYGKERLEAACCRALSTGSPTRKSVLSILKSGLDRQCELIALPAEAGIPLHGNVRGPGYYH